MWIIKLVLIKSRPRHHTFRIDFELSDTAHYKESDFWRTFTEGASPTFSYFIQKVYDDLKLNFTLALSPDTSAILSESIPVTTFPGAKLVIDPKIYRFFLIYQLYNCAKIKPLNPYTTAFIPSSAMSALPHQLNFIRTLLISIRVYFM